MYTIYAIFPALLPYSCRVHKEQNDQIQESDAGASVRVSGQNILKELGARW